MFFKKKSIRRKLLIGMMCAVIIPIFIITLTSLRITYNSMEEQLIYNRRMSIGWIKDRLDLEINEYSKIFYQFEIVESMKEKIQSWCFEGKELDYESQWQLISAMNSQINLKKEINSIELYNYKRNEVLVCARSGASLEETGERLKQWEEKNNGLQTNVVFLKEGNEILAIHQIFKFEKKQPIALMVVHMRPYFMQDIVYDIRMTTNESVIIFNNQDQMLISSKGNGFDIIPTEIISIKNQMKAEETTELYKNNSFWFYRPVSSGKMEVVFRIPDNVIISAQIKSGIVGFMVTIFTLIVAVVFVFLFSRFITKPIIHLSNRMKTLSIDEPNPLKETLQIEPDGTKDEIDTLNANFVSMINKNRNLIADKYQTQIEKKEAQLKALQAQINPHFMYNSLQVISGMAVSRNMMDIYEMTGALSDILRYSLSFSEDSVAIKEEITYLKSYLSIQDMRFPDRLHYTIDFPKDILECHIPKLIFQPIIENSFSHGLSQKKGKWKITIKGRRINSEKIEITFTDNGIGIQKDECIKLNEFLGKSSSRILDSNSHIGLSNVNARIKLFCSNSNYGLEILSPEDGGTEIILRLLSKKITTEEENG
jgi:sensor histidine kinase YesM